MATDIELIKKPYTEETYTVTQLQEIMKCAADPVYYIQTHMYIQHPTRGRVKFDLFDYQVKLLECYHNNRYNINMLGRQMGKCLSKDINITVKHKKTGKIYDIPIGKFHEYQHAKKLGLELPDISEYEST